MRWPFTKCFSGTRSGVLRPGRASSTFGIVAFLRNSAMVQPPGPSETPVWGRIAHDSSPVAACVPFTPHLKLASYGHQSTAEPSHPADREAAALWDPREPSGRRSVQKAPGARLAAPALVSDRGRARRRAGRDEPSARVLARRRQAGARVPEDREARREPGTVADMSEPADYPYATHLDIKFGPLSVVDRSEERRVGKECRCGRSPAAQ